jgi:thioesterase domain-containing protein
MQRRQILVGAFAVLILCTRMLLLNLPAILRDDIFVNFLLSRFAKRAKRWSTKLVKRASLRRGDAAMLAKHQLAAFLGSAEYSDAAKQFMGALHQTVQKYVPKQYDGKVLLYKTRAQGLFRLKQLDRKWGKIVSDLEVVSVGGNHVTLMLGKYVDGLAKDLNQRLAECWFQEASRNRNIDISSDLTCVAESAMRREY